MLCIKNGLIYTMAEKEPFKGDVLIEDGKIRRIGADLEGDRRRRNGGLSGVCGSTLPHRSGRLRDRL